MYYQEPRLHFLLCGWATPPFSVVASKPNIPPRCLFSLKELSLPLVA